MRRPGAHSRRLLATLAVVVAFAGAGVAGARLSDRPAAAPAAAVVDPSALEHALAAPVQTCGRQCAPARETLTVREATGTMTTTIYLVDPQAFRTGASASFLVPVTRRVPAADPVAGALAALFAGPTPAEAARGLRGAPWPGARVASWRLHDGIVDVHLAPGCVRVPSVPFGLALLRTVDAQPGVSYTKVFDAQGQTEVPQYDLDSLPTCLDVYSGRVRYLDQVYD